MLETIQLKLWENKNEILFLDDILNHIPNPSFYQWNVGHIWAMAKPGCDIKMFELEDMINNSISGVQYSYQELIDLNTCFFQIIDIYIEGFYLGYEFIKENTRDKGEGVIIIEKVDSSFWEIKTANVELLDSFKKKFELKK